MSDTHPTVKVARDLTEIVDMFHRLAAQAEHQATHSLMPGGLAMVALGNVANLEAWENLNASHERYANHPDERLRRVYTSAEDEDPDDAWSPFQLLEFWSEGWRREHGAEYGERPTLVTEANFIRWSLDWAWQNEVAWDDFAADVRRARVKMEDILHAGNRVELSRVACNHCDEGKRLVVLVGQADDGSEDRWKCPNCKHRYDREGLLRAHAAQLRQDSAAKFVDQRDAIATIVSQGRNERVVRRWLEPPVKHQADKCQECGRKWPANEHNVCPGKKRGIDCGGELAPLLKGDPEDVVGGFCDTRTKKTFVWWPDLWLRHCTTKTRKKASA